jgi:hypothetical protein
MAEIKEHELLDIISIEPLSEEEICKANEFKLEFVSEIQYLRGSTSCDKKKSSNKAPYKLNIGNKVIEIKNTNIHFDYIQSTWINTNSFYNGILVDDGISTSISLLQTISEMEIEHLMDMIHEESHTLTKIAEMLHLTTKITEVYNINDNHIKITKEKCTDSEYGTLLGDIIICNGRLYKIITNPIIKTIYSLKSLQLFQARLKSFLTQLQRPNDITTLIVSNNMALRINRYNDGDKDLWEPYIHESHSISIGKYYLEKIKDKNIGSIIAQIIEARKLVIAIHHFIIEFTSLTKVLNSPIRRAKKSKLFECNTVRLIMSYLDISSQIPDSKELLTYCNCDTSYRAYNKYKKSTNKPVSKENFTLFMYIQQAFISGITYTNKQEYNKEKQEDSDDSD